MPHSFLFFLLIACVCARSLQLCPALCDLMDCSLPSSSVYGILQARTVEWVAISFSRDLPDPGIEPVSPALVGSSSPLSHLGSPANCLGPGLCFIGLDEDFSVSVLREK